MCEKQIARLDRHWYARSTDVSDTRQIRVQELVWILKVGAVLSEPLGNEMMRSRPHRKVAPPWLRDVREEHAHEYGEPVEPPSALGEARTRDGNAVDVSGPMRLGHRLTDREAQGDLGKTPNVERCPDKFRGCLDRLSVAKQPEDD